MSRGVLRDGSSVYKEIREKRVEDVIIRASNKAGITKSDLSDAFKEKGFLGVYNLGMMHMYEYLKGEKV